ncbi:MAG: hypothetical protein ACE5PO_06490 [Candidatus Bathyarchaeia archaeon]
MVSDEEKARKAILRMMFGKSGEDVEKYLPELLKLWGLEIEKRRTRH